MRVAIFIDGKNFYSGWKDRVGGRRIDLREMASWIVKRAGGTCLWGAHYYTGIETGTAASAEGQLKLGGFLDMLEMQPGYFVERFPRKINNFQCSYCGADNRYTQEKEVDTAMVADIVRYAAIGAFDILVLVSGDADYAPALEAVRALGKQSIVATWGGTGLSYRIRKIAFEHIDLLDGLEAFDHPDSTSSSYPVAQASSGWYDPPITLRAAEVRLESSRVHEHNSNPQPLDDRTTFLEELRRAEEKFHGGYVGANYFVTRWASDNLPESPEARRHLLDQLVDDDLVERYDAPDGKKAIRLSTAALNGSLENENLATDTPNRIDDEGAPQGVSRSLHDATSTSSNALANVPNQAAAQSHHPERIKFDDSYTSTNPPPQRLVANDDAAVSVLPSTQEATVIRWEDSVRTPATGQQQMQNTTNQANDTTAQSASDETDRSQKLPYSSDNDQ